MSAHVRWRADLALVFVCMVWGATFVLVKEALADISTLLFLAVRFTMAATALTLVFLGPMRRAGNRGQAVRGGAIAGVLLFSGYVLQTFGLKLTTATKTAFITALYIPLVPVFSALIHRRAPQAAESTGVLMAAVGMGLMTAHRNLLEVSAGDLLVAGCAVAFALHIVALGSRRIAPGVRAGGRRNAHRPDTGRCGAHSHGDSPGRAETVRQAHTSVCYRS